MYKISVIQMNSMVNHWSYRLHAIQGNDYGLHINLNEVQRKLLL